MPCLLLSFFICVSGDREKHLNQFTAWCKENGVQNDKVELCSFDGFGVGVRSTQTIQVTQTHHLIQGRIEIKKITCLKYIFLLASKVSIVAPQSAFPPLDMCIGSAIVV